MGSVTALFVLLLTVPAVIFWLLAASAARDAKSAGKGRSGRAIALTVGLPILAMVAVVVGGRWIALEQDLRPSGPSCGFEDDPGSGWSGSGHEEIDWGVFPERVCVSGSGAVYRGVAVQGDFSNSLVHLIVLLSYPAALITGLVVGIWAGSVVDRRRSVRTSERAL